MSETAFSPEEISQALSVLLEAMKPAVNGLGQVALYKEVAKRLSALARKQPPWGWRYIQCVEKGTLAPSQKLTRAVFSLGATLDGVPTLVANTEPVQVYARPGTVRPGSIILGESRACARPGCPVSFIPRVPWQKYCSSECRRKIQKQGQQPQALDTTTTITRMIHKEI
jgi:hypothetical protein